MQAPTNGPAQPAFDGPSYQRVGAELIRAAGARPQLGLKLGAQAQAGEIPPYWYIGTHLASHRGARDSDVRYSTYTPYLCDLASRMEGGDFGLWVVGVAEDFFAGLLHRVARPNGKGVQMANSRMALAGQAAADGLYDEPEARPPLHAAPAAQIHCVNYAEADGAQVLRRRR